MTLKIYHIIFNLSTGGAERVLIDLVNYSHIDTEHSIIVLGKKNKHSSYLINNNVSIYYLNFNFFKLFFFFNKFKNKSNIFQFWLHNTFLLSLILRLISNAKIFWSIHNEKVTIQALGFKNFIFCYFNLFISKLINIDLIYCSHKSLNYHFNFGMKNNSYVIPNPLNIDTFYFSYKNPKKKGDKILFTMFANYTKSKDQKLLISALSLIKYSNFQCDLFGTGIKNNVDLLNLIKRHNLSNKISLNNFTLSDKLYYNYDFSFLISNSESFPMVVLESLATGTPCIASDVGDIKKIISNDDFIIFRNFNAILIAQKIDMLINLRHSTDKYNHISNQLSKKITNKYNINKIYQNYLSLWKK